MQRILWLSCGGTVACPPDRNNLSPIGGSERMREMLKAAPLPDKADITARCIMNIDSSEMDVCSLRVLAKAVYEGINEGFEGIVITHGTDTMAYTAAVLFYGLENIPPVIITGAQQPFYAENSDGPNNLANAFKAACDRRFSGVYLLFGDKIISGDRAVKIHTADYNGFVSAAGYGAIIKKGEFTEFDVKCPVYKDKCILREIQDNAALVKITPFTRPEEIAAAAARLSAENGGGLVIEGYGCCGIPGRLLGEIKKASDRGLRVVFVSQCLYGGTDGERYKVGVNAMRSGVEYGFALTAEGACARIAVGGKM